MYLVFRLREGAPAAVLVRYRLTYMYLRQSFDPRLVLLGLGLTVLRAQARLRRYLALYAALRAERKTYKVLPADASRASRDSARYKSLLKRHE